MSVNLCGPLLYKVVWIYSMVVIGELIEGIDPFIITTIFSPLTDYPYYGLFLLHV